MVLDKSRSERQRRLRIQPWKRINRTDFASFSIWIHKLTNGFPFYFVFIQSCVNMTRKGLDWEGGHGLVPTIPGAVDGESGRAPLHHLAYVQLPVIP